MPMPAPFRNAQQAVADWFRERLTRVQISNGYPMTFLPGYIYTDGREEVLESPDKPVVVYDDDSGEFQQASPPGRLVSFRPAVVVYVKATPGTYKRVARQVWAAVTHACVLDPMKDGDAPSGVVSIIPSGWVREYTDDSYVKVAITFSVSADDVARL